MKRGRGPKRHKPLKRTSELRPDPEKVRAFVRRARESASLKRAEGPQAGRKALVRRKRRLPVEGPLSPSEWRRQVFEASGGICIVSGTRARDVNDDRFDAHHIIPKQALRARGLYAHVWDPRNGMWLAERAHGRHELAFRRVPRSKLPPAAWEFAREMDAALGTEWATRELERKYPAAGPGGISK